MKAFVVLAALVACTAALPTVRIDPEGDWRVVGGSTAAAGQFPFIVSQRSGSTTVHQCSGSILNTRWILTAAHCITGSGTMTFVAGSRELNFGGVRFSVSRRIIHGSYAPNTITNDVGVVELASTITLTTSIQTVALSTDTTGGGVDVTFAGWGRTSIGASISNDLLFLHMTTITVADCQNRMGLNPITSTNLCTIVPTGQGTCRGNAGGPLVLRGTRTQVGISSWEIPCGIGFPDIFTRVSSYISWINTAISS